MRQTRIKPPRGSALAYQLLAKLIHQLDARCTPVSNPAPAVRLNSLAISAGIISAPQLGPLKGIRRIPQNISPRWQAIRNGASPVNCANIYNKPASTSNHAR
jgi:hypothetical protein